MSVEQQAQLLNSYGKLRGGHTFRTLPFSHRAVLSSPFNSSATTATPSTPKAGLRESFGQQQSGQSEIVESFRHLCSQELALPPSASSSNSTSASGGGSVSALSSAGSANLASSSNSISNTNSNTNLASSTGVSMNGLAPNVPVNQALILPKTVERTLHGYNLQVRALEASAASASSFPPTPSMTPKSRTAVKKETKVEPAPQPQFYIELEDPGHYRNLVSPQPLLDSPVESVLSLPECTEFALGMMMKSVGLLMMKQDIDTVESDQVMEVMGELTACFLRFFGGMLRREMDTPGRVGTEAHVQKNAMFTCLDAAFGNGIYDVVDYALDLNSPHIHQWSQQYQHLIPYRPQRGLPKSLVSQSLLMAAAQSQAASGSTSSASQLLAGVAGGDPMLADEDLPPRQWAVYATHVPFAKAHPEIVRAQPFFYENVGDPPPNASTHPAHVSPHTPSHPQQHAPHGGSHGATNTNG